MKNNRNNVSAAEQNHVLGLIMSIMFFVIVTTGAAFAFYNLHKDKVQYEIVITDKYAEEYTEHPEQSKYYVTYDCRLISGNSDVKNKTVTELVTKDDYYKNKCVNIGKKHYRKEPYLSI